MTEPHRLAPQAPVHAAQPSAQASLDLALIGNCAVSGLIDAQGRLVWACVPRFDGDPIFCNLLRDGDGQGVWEFAVEDAVSVVQAYARNAPVLRTVITDARGGAFEITDFCPRFPHYGRMFRPMAFMRRLRPIAGAPRITVRLRPMQDDGAAPQASRAEQTTSAMWAGLPRCASRPMRRWATSWVRRPSASTAP